MTLLQWVGRKLARWQLRRILGSMPTDGEMPEVEVTTREERRDAVRAMTEHKARLQRLQSQIDTMHQR